MKHDKSQQFNSETVNQQTFKYETVEMAPYNNSVLEQTIRFAKNLVPLVIPPLKETSSTPVFYTIKTSRKHKKQDKKRESSAGRDATYNKDHVKIDDTNKTRKRHKENYSARESLDPSSQNTLEDIHININQSCSFSESTEVKYHKRAPRHYKNGSENSQKIFISNSFEALANESISDGNKIKIHLMNDTDKIQFRDSIKNPIVNTIRDYLSQINTNNDFSTDLNTVQKVLRTNCQKLDDILEKLSCIEKKIDTHDKQQTNQATKTPRAQSAKASKLEELGQDIIEVKEHYASEEENLREEYNNLLQRRKNRGKSVVVAIDPKEQAGKSDKNKDSLGCGEDVPGPLNDTSSMSQLGVKPERPIRIPARFCWTDADRKK